MQTFRAAVRVRPGARVEHVGGAVSGARADQLPALAVQVRARAVEGAATAAVERALAEALGIRARQVRVVRGATSRDKLIEVSDPPQDIADRWAALLADASS